MVSYQYIVVLTAVLFGVNSCGAPKPETFHQRGLICDTPGFCLTDNDGTHFYGAYRLDDRELQFKVLYHRWEPFDLIKTQDRYSACLMTEEQSPIIYDNNCVEDEGGRAPDGLSQYQEIARRFLHYMQKNSFPKGREGEWQQLYKMIEHFATDPLVVPA